ncbi:hypothetical protein [Dehalobacter sp.]|uniref:hypothetical protein n=1 Tax=Dehalobacter sp. TaxID=1962289 RepID=UPI002589477C|nr:hypothetical protein [Dehalobacter sp.]MDJ0305775.1 hypothetical protein [Dehalobacter sp.]
MFSVWVLMTYELVTPLTIIAHLVRNWILYSLIVSFLIVMAFREGSSCESEDLVVAVGGRIDFVEFIHSSSHKVARFVERKFNCKSMETAPSFPGDQSKPLPIGEVSQRHAAKAAGYTKSFSRNNSVI